MIDFNRVIKMLSKDEITMVIKVLEEELKERQRKTEVFEFYFEAKDVPRKAHPYVARLFWVNGKLRRKFYSFTREYKKDTVSIHGTYKAPAGAVLEARHGVDNTSWYLVTSNGSQIPYGRQPNKDGKHILIEYLKDNLTLQEVEEDLNKHFNDMFGFERLD